MMRNDGATAFAYDGRMRDAFGIAHIHDVPNDVVSVFLKRIICRTVEIAARAVIIDAESAPDIEITELMSEFTKLCVIAPCFAHGTFDGGDVRHLRPDVEMNELEAMCEASRF